MRCIRSKCAFAFGDSVTDPRINNAVAYSVRISIRMFGWLYLSNSISLLRREYTADGRACMMLKGTTAGRTVETNSFWQGYIHALERGFPRFFPRKLFTPPTCRSHRKPLLFALLSSWSLNVAVASHRTDGCRRSSAKKESIRF
jgi:hypothetical protein